MLVATGAVEIAKVPADIPCGIVTLDGTVATFVLLLESETTLPPLGAGPLSLTVAVALLPPFTLVREMDKAVTAGGVTVTVADFTVPLQFAVTVTGVELDTGKVVAETTTEPAPCGAVTLDGTAATEELLEDRVKVTPPA